MLDGTVLVYKRTHPGDPDERGVFGIQDCMGRVRLIEFDAVIGIGGIGSQAKSYGIDGKLNWLGIGPHKIPASDGRRGPLVAFDVFHLWEDKGENLSKIATALKRRFCHAKAPRFATKFSKAEERDIQRLLERFAKQSQRRQTKLRHLKRCRPCVPPKCR